MLQGTLNKFVTVPLATAFGLFLWDDIKSLMELINRTKRRDDPDEWKVSRTS